MLKQKTEKTNSGPSTQAVHGNRQANPYHAVAQPIVQTAIYTFEDTADLINYKEDLLWGRETDRQEYLRYGNPTIRAAEERLASIEGAEDALLFSSGMAALTTVLLTMLPSDTHIVITDDCYRRTREFALRFLKRWGIGCSVVSMGDYQAMEAAIQPNTRLIVSESPTNPYLRVLDLERVSAIARRHKVKTIVDATFATPFNVRPLEYGIDLVIHSATKYLAGHNDQMAGVVAGKAPLIASFRESLGVLGAVTDPQNAAQLLRGLKTLGLRIKHQNNSGQAVAELLEAHPKVERVWYPGLPSHPEHEIAKKQMAGFGGVVSFTIKGDRETTSQFIDALEIPLLAVSLGGTESLVIQPALMSFYEFSPEERLEVGITDNLVRFSLGIEDTEDILQDLEQALELIP